MLEIIKQYTFRQFLIPRNNQTEFNPSRKQHQIDPKILNAIGDNAQPITPPTYIDGIVNFYKRYMFIIRPDNYFLLAWDTLIITIVVFYIFQMGLLLCFQKIFWEFELSSALGVHITFILILSIDIFISPFKAYYSDGLLVVDIQTIIKNYLKLQIFIDIIAVLAIVIPLATGSFSANWIKLFWVIKIYTVSKINIQFQRITQLNITYSTIYLCVKLAVVLVVYAHYLGIGFYLVSEWVYNNNYYGPNTPNICWIYNSQAFYQMNLLLSWQDQYIYIMYYSIGIVTTIAYGDIIPRNPIECIYSIFTFIMFTIVFGYVFTEIIRLLVNVYSYNFERRYNHFQLIQQLKSQNVPLSTRVQVRSHTEKIDREEQFRNREVENKILNFLPDDPLYGLLLVIYRDFLKRLQINFAEQHLFQKFKPIAQKSLFLQHFMKEIKEERQYIGDIIFQAGQIQSETENGHCVYFYTKKQYRNAVTIGVGQLPNLKFGMITDDRKNVSSFELRKAQRMYGQIQFFNGQSRSHWAICQLNCVVFAASRNSLFSNYHLLTQQQKQIIFSKMQRALQVSCYICQRDHFFLKCPYTFPKFDDLIQKDSKVGRSNRVHRQFRTRLKTQSSWTIFNKIRNQRLEITKQYKDKLLMDKLNQNIFIEQKLQDISREQEEQQVELEEKIYQIEAIIQKVQDNQVEYFTQTLEQLQYDQYDKSYSFKHYRTHNNLAQIQREMNHPSKRKANLEDIVQSSLIRLFQF